MINNSFSCFRYMTKGNNKVTFYFAKLHKIWGKGKPSASFKPLFFLKINNYGVIKTLHTYLSRTKDRRFGKSQVLLSFQRLYMEVISSISRWVEKVLKLEKIDTDTYKAHSTRLASASDVKLKDLSLADILKRGSWSRKSTWQMVL